MGIDVSKAPDAVRKQLAAKLRRDPATGCLEFTGYRDKNGYGLMVIRCDGQKRTVRAHRLAFACAGGVVTVDAPHVLHSSDNPACCEPAHLFAGNDDVNRKDMARKGRGLRSKRGNPFGAIFHQGAWVSQARANGRNNYLGRYDTWQEASARAFLHKNLALYPDLGVN